MSFGLPLIRRLASLAMGRKPEALAASLREAGGRICALVHGDDPLLKTTHKRDGTLTAKTRRYHISRPLLAPRSGGLCNGAVDAEECAADDAHED